MDAAVALTRLRAEVLDAGDADRLGEIVRPGSPADRADRALLDRLAAAVVALDGVTAVVDHASLVSDGPGDPSGGLSTGPDDPPDADAGQVVDVRVRSGLGAHTRRSPAGTTAVPAEPTRAVVLRLAWTDDGWRVWDVRPG